MAGELRHQALFGLVALCVARERVKKPLSSVLRGHGIKWYLKGTSPHFSQS
jgi:hypothetical protein